MTKTTILKILSVLLLVIALAMTWMTSKRFRADAPILRSKVVVSKGASTKSNQSLPKKFLDPSDRTERTRDLLNAGNVSITFFGKVIDESGVGVPGVSIKYRIQRAGRLEPNGAISDDKLQSSLTSSADGSFKVTNVKGTILSMETFTKSGYELTANQKMDYGYYGTPKLHNPREDSPQIFRMRKNKAPNDVKHVSKQLRIPWDGKAIRIDLSSVEASPTGELILTASRTASTGRFGWSVSLEINGGGLIEAETGTALIAPENGYLPVWKCGFASDANPWRFGYDTNLYYRLKGKYGRLKLQIYADAGPTDIGIYLDEFIK